MSKNPDLAEILRRVEEIEELLKLLRKYSEDNRYAIRYGAATLPDSKRLEDDL